MYVCLCNSVTDHQIRQAVSEGVCTMRGLSLELGVATCCGKCTQTATRVMLNQLAEITRDVSEAETSTDVLGERAQRA